MQGQTNSLSHPNSIGNYSILSNDVLGKGATGTVYKGTIVSI